MSMRLKRLIGALLALVAPACFEAAAADPRISEGFRALCGEHAQALRPLARASPQVRRCAARSQRDR